MSGQSELFLSPLATYAPWRPCVKNFLIQLDGLRAQQETMPAQIAPGILGCILKLFDITRLQIQNLIF
jgi:hypothetical protein